jgi:hypothetical protein
VTCITSGDHFFQVAVLCLDDLVSCFSLKLNVTGPTQLPTCHCFHWNFSFLSSSRSGVEASIEAGTAFGLLTIEFWLYERRHPSTKARFARRFSIVRERLAEQIARSLGPAGVGIGCGVVHPAPR